MQWPLLTVKAIVEGLRTERIGRVVEVLDEAPSTNDVALAAAERSVASADGLAVFAEYQTAGRGRQGRTWHAPRGASLLCSVVLLGPDEMAQAGLLTLVAGVAACDAVRETSGIWPMLRWPNDLYVGSRKLGGILVESRPIASGQRAWVIGAGINCYQHANHFPPEIRDQATSLEIESIEPINRTALARQCLSQLDMWLKPGTDLVADRLRSAWLDRAESLGRPVRLRYEGRVFEGRTVDVDPQAGLLVQLNEGARRWFDAARSQIV
ncbi:MAG: biotin--[acetyl-CoA-carboxylase] ligase [Phycisphaerae bacterium]|nr:biotin--[acetyl-CoA-carboxylase] ligase [Phycisphaerae bacterium]